jgi:hypothetical protein
MASEKQSSNARRYSTQTTRMLDMYSGGECYHPECVKKLIGEDGLSIVGKRCHISAASPDGPRYDAAMTDEERSDFGNLILLCDEHHVIIDNKANEGKYTVEVLKRWKTNHERKIGELLASKDLLSKHPLALNRVVNLMGRKIAEILDFPEAANAPNTTQKIHYNDLIRWGARIKDFAPYQGKLNKIYEEVEKEGSTKKDLVLYNIKNLYIEVKMKYGLVNEIKDGSDRIFDHVYDRLIEIMELAPNKLEDLDQETIRFSLMVIIVDAFMRCKIMEEPPHLLR